MYEAIYQVKKLSSYRVFKIFLFALIDHLQGLHWNFNL